ncbi:ABC transporter ATP-binding protein [Luteimicrobium subarcticum]|uniref:ABC-2 type transport system ATP-binding protein n=1 Tax=Luteimicrobium subarcticum TaxID=620910 RepID=A0A2M8WR51_9MICO|nr:ABC transporter ATP-binding protein [Luteimicrobium subarcticum]PJI93384.1 ABC-2 type transport system ATP-binding protein [Luteimicrobium subarcticum]
MHTTTTATVPGALPRTPALALRGLHKTFGSPSATVRAVDGLDLTIMPGEVVAFLGPNGAGKTTTIDMVLGLAEPSAGTVQVFGQSPADAIAAGRVAAVMQTGGLLRDITVAETVELTAALFGRKDAKPHPFLERAGIADIAGRMVGKCSGGQQQRLRFAMALVSEPDLLLLDEPTTGMDVEGRRDFWASIREDAARGRTVVFATHYLEEADAYADRIVLVAHGRVVADGSAAEIKKLASGRTVTAAFPDATHLGAAADAVRALPGVEQVDTRGLRLVVRGADSDAVARYLLTGTSAHDLEVTAENLEEAFVALTGDGPHASAASHQTAPALDGADR